MAQPNERTVLRPYKLVLVGEKGTGKTTFLSKLSTTKATEIPWLDGVKVNRVRFPTDSGPIYFDCWESSASYGLHDNCYLGADCAIILFDVTESSTYMYLVAALYNHIKLLSGNIPVVLCGNKADLDKNNLKAEHVPLLTDEKLQYYEISAETNRNIEEPFLYLARILAGDPRLHFVKPIL